MFAPLPLLLSCTWNLAPPHAADDALTLEGVREMAARIQGQIEELRGLRFLAEVAVELADHDEFVEHARANMEREGGEARARAEARAARMLGLVPGDCDLEALVLDVLAEQVGGFYDPVSKTFYIMETIDPVMAEVVIAHEYTHALDDQHHDLDGAAQARLANGDAQLAHHALAEGSGMEVMTQWSARHLSFSDLRKLAEAQAAMPTDAIAAAPPYVWKPLIAIYLQGQAFLRRKAKPAMFGRARVEDIEAAFADPPASTEQVLHPDKYWGERDLPQPISCAAEALPAGWSLSLDDTLGELLCAMVCQPFEDRGGMGADPMSILGMEFTSAAAAGWDGDRYALVEDGAGGMVLRLTSVWDTPEDAREFAAALTGLADGVEASKRRAGEPAAAGSGWEVTLREPDGVEVLSYWGVDADAARSVARSLSFVRD